MPPETLGLKGSGLNMAYHLRTAAGFLVIVCGIAAGVWFGWWLSFRGDVIQILSMAKAGLPGWGWWALKFALSGLFALVLLVVFITIGVLVLRGRGSKS